MTTTIQAVDGREAFRIKINGIRQAKGTFSEIANQFQVKPSFVEFLLTGIYPHDIDYYTILTQEGTL